MADRDEEAPEKMADSKSAVVAALSIDAERPGFLDLFLAEYLPLLSYCIYSQEDLHDEALGCPVGNALLGVGQIIRQALSGEAGASAELEKLAKHFPTPAPPFVSVRSGQRAAERQAARLIRERLAALLGYLVARPDPHMVARVLPRMTPEERAEYEQIMDGLDGAHLLGKMTGVGNEALRDVDLDLPWTGTRPVEDGAEEVLLDWRGGDRAALLAVAYEYVRHVVTADPSPLRPMKIPKEQIDKWRANLREKNIDVEMEIDDYGTVSLIGARPISAEEFVKGDPEWEAALAGAKKRAKKGPDGTVEVTQLISPRFAAPRCLRGEELDPRKRISNWRAAIADSCAAYFIKHEQEMWSLPPAELAKVIVCACLRKVDVKTPNELFDDERKRDERSAPQK